MSNGAPGTDRDTALVADFVRRLRRVALHPLAIQELDHGLPGLPPMPGDLLRHLMTVPTEQVRNEDGTVTLRTPLPDEVQFESLATRLRPLTLARDRLHWTKALDALEKITGQVDALLSRSTAQIRAEWTIATDRTSRARAFFTGYQAQDDAAVAMDLTDIDLAYAWLYQDVAHGDEVSTGLFGILERYQAAVSVFSHIAVVAIETLHYIDALAELGSIALPIGTFSDAVVVTATEHTMTGSIIETEIGNDLSDPTLADQLPDELRPAFALAQRMVQGRADDPQSEAVAMTVRDS
jgi:hypothetical protein